MNYKRGDVVLVPFPDVERLGEKRRPAVVVSADVYNASCPDIIAAQITSRRNPPPRPGDHRVRDWQAAGLVKPSLVRARLAAFHRSRVVRKLGRASTHDMDGVDRGLRAALAL